MVGAEWGRVKEEEIRTKKEWGAGGKSWEATWNMAQGTPGYMQTCFFTLPGPDKGQSIFPIRSRQNSNAALRLNWQNIKRWWAYFVRLSPGANQSLCASPTQECVLCASI